MDVLATKIVVLVLLVTLRMGAGFIPISMKKRFFGETKSPLHKQQIEMAVACCLSFASGVLLATCFIHLAPEIREILSESMPNHKLPITELLICAGFFLIFFVDEIILMFSGYSTQVKPELDDESSLSISIKELSEISYGPRRLVLAVGLSCHSVIEGLALGFLETPANVWFMFVATSVHECILLFSVSLHMMASDVNVAYVLIFLITSSLVSPLGMLLGMFSSSGNPEDSAVVAVIQGLAAGTILYITFYEVLTRKVRTQCSGILSLLFSILGFLIMLALQLIEVYHYEDEELPETPATFHVHPDGSDYESYGNNTNN